MSAVTRPRGRSVIALLGLRCSGKSTLARLLAAELGRASVDLDEEALRFARYAGWHVASVGELIERAGWAVYRELEAVALRRVLEPEPRVVLATGGGVVERADNRVWLARTARRVYLSVPLATLAARMRADATPRPPILGADAALELPELLARREPHYRALAEIVLECGDEEPPALVRRLLAALAPPF